MATKSTTKPKKSKTAKKPSKKTATTTKKIATKSAPKKITKKKTVTNEPEENYDELFAKIMGLEAKINNLEMQKLP